MRAAVLATLLLILAAPIVATGAPTPPDCRDITQRPALATQGFYVFIFPSGWTEIWQESNGIDSLQRVHTHCTGREPIPNDTCITHSETYTLVSCVINALV